LFGKDVQCLKRPRPPARMRGDGKSRFAVCDGGGTNKTRVYGRQRPFVEPDLDEAGFDASVFNAPLPFVDPPFCEGFRGSRQGVGGQEFVLSRAVIACVGHQVRPLASDSRARSRGSRPRQSWEHSNSASKPAAFMAASLGVITRTTSSRSQR